MRYSSQVITHSALFILFVWIMFCQRSPHHPLARLWLNSALAIRCYLITKYTFNSTLSQTTILVLIVFFFFLCFGIVFLTLIWESFSPTRGDVNSWWTSAYRNLLGYFVIQSVWRTCYVFTILVRSAKSSLNHDYFYYIFQIPFHSVLKFWPHLAIYAVSFLTCFTE